MNIRVIAMGALAILIAHTANASPIVFFDSVDVPNPTFGSDGPVSGSVIDMADSFTAASPSFTRIGVLLAADNPSDGGSTTIKLVADNGGGSTGVAGSPSFGSAVTLGTVADASLAKLGSGATLTSLFVSAPSFSTLNNEYWIELLPSAGSSVEWYFAAGGSGVGETGQASYFTDDQGSTRTADSSTTFGGPYDLMVDTPEPASIATFGGALAALGYARRRNAKKIGSNPGFRLPPRFSASSLHPDMHMAWPPPAELSLPGATGLMKSF